MKHCPYCKAELAENARFCLYCMKPLSEKEIIPPVKSPNRWVPVTLTVLVLLLVGGIYFLLKYGIPENNPVLSQPVTTQTTAESTSPTQESTQPVEESQTTATTAEQEPDVPNTPVTPPETQVFQPPEQDTQAPTSQPTEPPVQETTTPETTPPATQESEAAPPETTQPLQPTTEATQPEPPKPQPVYTYRAARSGDEFNATYQNAGNDIVITGIAQSAPDGVYDIPAYIDGQRVIAITANAFSNSNAQVVYIPASLRYIHNYAFSSCPLTDIYFRGNSIRMENQAFSGTPTIHCSSNCENRNFYYYKNIAPDYGATWEEWNG